MVGSHLWYQDVQNKTRLVLKKILFTSEETVSILSCKPLDVMGSSTLFSEGKCMFSDRVHVGRTLGEAEVKHPDGLYVLEGIFRYSEQFSLLASKSFVKGCQDVHRENKRLSHVEKDVIEVMSNRRTAELDLTWNSDVVGCDARIHAMEIRTAHKVLFTTASEDHVVHAGVIGSIEELSRRSSRYMLRMIVQRFRLASVYTIKVLENCKTAAFNSYCSLNEQPELHLRGYSYIKVGHMCHWEASLKG